MSKIKEWCQSLVDSGLTSQMPANIDAAIYEQYAKYLEAENEKLKQALDDIKVFGLEMKSGKIDMTVGSETFNYVTSMLVQVLAQNNAQNFLTTSIEISNQKYSVTAQKCNGKTPAEEIATLKAENEDLTVKNEVLQRDVENLTRTLEEGGEEYKALQEENEELRVRLENAVELPYKPDAIDVGLTKVVMSPCDESVRLDTAIYIYKKMPNIEEAEKFIEKHTGDQQ